MLQKSYLRPRGAPLHLRLLRGWILFAECGSRLLASQIPKEGNLTVPAVS